MTAQIVKLPAPTAKWECTQCGASVDAACDCGCGAKYVPPGRRAAHAVAATPEKSDRAFGSAPARFACKISKLKRKSPMTKTETPDYHDHFKQTPENVWQATSVCLWAIIWSLLDADLIKAADIRATSDAALTQLERMIGKEDGPGIYGTDNPPLDHGNFAAIQEMVDMFCKEAEAFGIGRRRRLSVVDGGKTESDPPKKDGA